MKILIETEVSDGRQSLFRVAVDGEPFQDRLTAPLVHVAIDQLLRQVMFPGEEESAGAAMDGS